MAKKDGRLLVYEKTYRLMLHTRKLMEKFPKTEKYALCSEIKNSELTCMKKFIYAWRIPNNAKRIECLTDIDAELYILKAFARLSYDFKYISDKNYVTWDEMLNEIGRLVGAWTKKCQNV